MTNSAAADSGFADAEASHEPSVIHGDFLVPLQALGQNGQSAAAGALSSGTNQGGVSNSATNSYTDYHDDGSRSEYWEDGTSWWFLEYDAAGNLVGSSSGTLSQPSMGSGLNTAYQADLAANNAGKPTTPEAPPRANETGATNNAAPAGTSGVTQPTPQIIQDIQNLIRQGDFIRAYNLTLLFQQGMATGFFQDGLAGQIQGLADLARMQHAVSAQIGAFALNPYGYISGIGAQSAQVKKLLQLVASDIGQLSKEELLQALLTGDFSGIADRVSPVTLELLQITSAIGHGLLDYLTEDLTLEEASVLLGRLYGAVLYEVAVSAATAGAGNALKGAEGAALTARILKQLESVPGLAKGKLGRISELMTDVFEEVYRAAKAGQSTTNTFSPNDLFGKGIGRSKVRKLLGDPPAGMVDPHAHHILFKKGIGPAQQALVEEGQAILRKVGIDPINGKENLVWAPWRVSKQHGIESLKKVVDKLRELDKAGADYDDFVEALKMLGREAAERGT